MATHPRTTTLRPRPDRLLWAISASPVLSISKLSAASLRTLERLGHNRHQLTIRHPTELVRSIGNPYSDAAKVKAIAKKGKVVIAGEKPVRSQHSVTLVK